MDEDGEAHLRGGRRKDGKPYARNNTRDDGGYKVGRNRTPESGKFRKGDGRKRGVRKAGVRNADTEFKRELDRKVTITESGQKRKVTKGLAADLRLIDNAMKGDNKAIEMVDFRRQRIAHTEEANERYHPLGNAELLHAYLKEKHHLLNIDPALYGDPEPSGPGPTESDNPAPDGVIDDGEHEMPAEGGAP